MAKTSNAQHLIPEVEITLADGTKAIAKCSMASLVAYENLTGNSVFSLKLKSASEMVKFLACAIHGSDALPHLASLSENLAPGHFKVIAGLLSQFFPSTEEEEEGKEGDSPAPETEPASE